jgi:hypothetical protein
MGGAMDTTRRQQPDRVDSRIEPDTPRSSHQHNTDVGEASKEYSYLPVPEYEASINSQHVVFDQIVIARHGLCMHAQHFENEEALQKDKARWTYAHYLPLLWKLYEKAEGKFWSTIFVITF